MQYSFSLFSKYPNLFAAFSQRSDGSMKFFKDAKHLELIAENNKNREKFLKHHGIKNLVYAELTHSNNVELILPGEKLEIIENCDGLITREKGIFLSVTAADCLPIFLFEPKYEIIGMIHAGWRSLEKGILSNAIEKISKLGGRPENILVGIGPAICQKHYEVGQEVAEKFTKYPETIKKKDEKTYLDIKKIAQLQLLELGIKKENIEISPECTYELPKKYFSARRDLPLTNCSINNKTQSENNNEFRNQQLVRGEKKEVEAMIAVIGMKRL
jgi:polyphenol oxidase